MKQHRGIEQRSQRKIPRPNQKGWKNGEQAVKEHFAGDEHRGVTVGHLPHHQAVHRPRQGGQQRKYVAQWRELQHKITVENHQPHSQQCQQRTAQQAKRSPLIAIEKLCQQHGKQRGAAHNESHVGGECHFESCIFGKEIHGATSDTGQQHP